MTSSAAHAPMPGQLSFAVPPSTHPDDLKPAARRVYDALLVLAGPADSHTIGERVRRPANATAARCGDLVRAGLARQLPEKVPGPFGVAVAQWELIA